MSSLSALGFIRFDVEDFLTPESDHALFAMLKSMARAGLPGSYGLVGKKAWALRQRHAMGAIERLKVLPAIGYHSFSHSEHPTLAEDLATRDYREGVHHFISRERLGVEAVTEVVKAPDYFTQPGGNWVPEAVEALPALGMDIYFTDSFNSYVVDLTQPYWYGEVLHLSFPVVNPRPFGLGLPQNKEEAVSLVEPWQDRHGEAFMVMLHPTELVTYEFWDAVNFSHGKTIQDLRPAPVRTPAEQAAALAAFDWYCDKAASLNIDWCDTARLRHLVAPRRPVDVTKAALHEAIRETGLGPLELAHGTLSAAEAFYALAVFEAMQIDGVSVPFVRAPEFWQYQPTKPILSSRDRRQAYARAIVAEVQSTGRLPSRPVTGLTLEAGLALLLAGEIPKFSFLDYIKPQDQLHWDWPIFSEGFRPVRLWQDARRLAWTLKRARYRHEEA